MTTSHFTLQTSQFGLDGYPEVLEDLWGKISDLLPGYGIDAETAAEAAFGITEFIRQEWSGRNHYVKKPAKAKAAPDAEPSMFDAPPAPEPQVDLSEHLQQLRDAAAAILADLGCDDAAAPARAVVDLVRSDWAGEHIYIPKGIRFDLSRRDYSIWRLWDGSYSGKLRLMQQHDLTEQRFYQIVAAVRRREFKRTQPALPGMEEAV